jgi:hypothetical protein
MKSLLAAAALALAFAAPASAQMMGSYPQDYLNAVRAYGSAQLDMGTGDQQPLVTGTIDGNNYGILMYGCEDGPCDSIQFFATFTTTRNGLTLMNQWNEDQRFGAAYVASDGTVILHWSVNVDFGITRQNFDDSFDIWRLTLGEFVDHVYP